MECRRCGTHVDPESGRDGRWCLSCSRSREAGLLRDRLRRGPRVVVAFDGTVGYELGGPGENPLGYLRTYGIVGNAWASWMARVGLLDDYFDRPVAEQDFGDPESREVARRLGAVVDHRRFAR